MMTYGAFDARTQTAIEGSTLANIDALADYAKAMADELHATGDISLEERNIVYHNADGWRNAWHTGQTPPDWQREIQP